MNNKEQPVNINTATTEELARLPGLEPAQAEAIIEHRETHGPFEDTVHVVQVEGIDETLYNIFLKDRITTEALRAEPAPTDTEVVETPEGTLPPPPEGEADAGPETQPAEEAPEIDEPAAEPPEPEAPLPEEAGVIPEEPQFTPPHPPAEETPDRDGCAATVVQWLVLLFLSAVLGTALSLGILYARNGTLNFSEVRGVRQTRADIVELQNQQAQLRADLQALQQQADRLSQAQANLEEKTNTLETYTGTIRNELETAKDDIQDTAQDVETLQSDVATLETNVKAVATESAQFDGFMTRLRDVLIEFQGTPIPTSTPTTTSTPTPSPTTTPTQTSTPTPLPATPTAEGTPPSSTVTPTP